MKKRHAIKIIFLHETQSYFMQATELLYLHILSLNFFFFYFIWKIFHASINSLFVSQLLCCSCFASIPSWSELNSQWENSVKFFQNMLCLHHYRGTLSTFTMVINLCHFTFFVWTTYWAVLQCIFSLFIVAQLETIYSRELSNWKSQKFMRGILWMYI